MVYRNNEHGYHAWCLVPADCQCPMWLRRLEEILGKKGCSVKHGYEILTTYFRRVCKNAKSDY